MENFKRKPDKIGRNIRSIEEINRPYKPYKGELDESRYQLEDNINNLIKNYQNKHKVNAVIEKDPRRGKLYYIRLFIDLDSSIY